MQSNIVQYPHTSYHQDVELEVIGQILLSEKMASYAFDRIEPEYFAVPDYKTIYVRLRDSAIGGEVTTAAMRDVFRDDYARYKGIVEECIQSVTTVNVKASTDRLIAEHTRRKIIDGINAVAANITDPASFGADADRLLDILHDGIEHCALVRSESGGLLSPAALVGEFEKALADRSRPINTGLHDVDAILGGLKPGNLCVLGGGTSMGKTAFALSWTLNLIREGKRIAYYGMEMSPAETVARFVSMELGIASMDMRQNKLTPQKEQAAFDYAQKLRGKSFYYGKSLNAGLASLARQLRRQKARYGLDIAFLDHLGLIPLPGKARSRYEGVTEITRQLKLLAENLEIPIVLLCQINRKHADRAEKEPQLSDLRDSGSIEQDADQVMFVYRPKKNLEEVQPLQDLSHNARGDFATRRTGLHGEIHTMPDAQDAQVLIRKNRHGRTGEAQVRWNGARTLYY